MALFAAGLLVVTLFALAACSSSGSKAPSIGITSPMNGSTISAGNVIVSVKVSNFNIVNKLGQTNVSGEGHIHYFFDVDAPTTQGQPAVTAAGTYAATAATSYTWSNVTPGTHSFSVELVNNDHTPLNPPYVAKIIVTVSPISTPSPTPTASSTPTPTLTPTATTTATANKVSIQGFAFSPSSISVPVGTTVTWTNKDSVTHTVTSDTGAFASGNLAPGKTFSFTFNQAGTFAYHCNIHTYMHGTVVVD